MLINDWECYFILFISRSGTEKTILPWSCHGRHVLLEEERRVV